MPRAVLRMDGLDRGATLTVNELNVNSRVALGCCLFMPQNGRTLRSKHNSRQNKVIQSIATVQQGRDGLHHRLVPRWTLGAVQRQGNGCASFVRHLQ